MRRAAQLLGVAKALLEDVEHNLELVQEGQLLYYKQILMYTLYALGNAVDALILSRLGVKPAGHNDRLYYLSQLGRADLKELYEWLIVLVFSKLETVAPLSRDDLRNIVSKVRDVISMIEAEVTGTQHV